ncbi:unnamed protein product [Moneuplotes crassus]|uniref:Ankyrin repeat protein n=1 Tax=Euplotes crassus TaxID=5936 RepID=A0AAD1URP8_EUPCR|nr:unnamed protein product [Moneuplotes crassus]
MEQQEEASNSTDPYQEKTDWGSSLREAQNSLSFLVRDPFDKVNSEKLKMAFEKEAENIKDSEFEDEEAKTETPTTEGDSKEGLNQRIKHKEDLQEKLRKTLMSKITKQALEKEKNRKLSESKLEQNYYTDIEDRLQPDFFKNEIYQPFFNSSVWEDYEELVYAIERDKFSLVIDIFEKGAFHAREIVRPTGDNIMHVCAEFGRVKMLSHFYKKGGELCSKNYADELPIHLAAREGQVETINYILENSTILIDTTTVDLWTPFHYAVNNGYLATIEFLISKGAGINTIDKFGRTALHWAVRYNFKEIVEFLLKHNINHEIRDKEGRTALDIAKSVMNLDLISIIEDYQKTRAKSRKK